jgi:hypothetical protein
MTLGKRTLGKMTLGKMALGKLGGVDFASASCFAGREGRCPEVSDSSIP